MKEESKVVLNEEEMMKEIKEVEKISLFKAIKEHLITKGKYNDKCLELELEEKKNERLILQKNTIENIYETDKQTWEEALEKKNKEIIELKDQIVELLMKETKKTKKSSKKEK